MGHKKTTINQERLAGKVWELLRDQLAPDPRFTLGWKIIEDLGADSLDIVELIMAVEDEFDIEIPVSPDPEKFETGRDIVQYLQNKI